MRVQVSTAGFRDAFSFEFFFKRSLFKLYIKVCMYLNYLVRVRLCGGESRVAISVVSLVIPLYCVACKRRCTRLLPTFLSSRSVHQRMLLLGSIAWYLTSRVYAPCVVQKLLGSLLGFVKPEQTNV